MIEKTGHLIFILTNSLFTGNPSFLSHGNLVSLYAFCKGPSQMLSGTQADYNKQVSLVPMLSGSLSKTQIYLWGMHSFYGVSF